jgi:ubiquinone/menaquinone biosynthesis C-methylase UbiE
MPSTTIEGKRAKEYEAYLLKDPKQKLFDSFIIRNIEPQKHAKLCELCCGPGNNLSLLEGKLGELVGVDLSEDMVRICKAKFARSKQIRVIKASATDTRLPSGHFDYVLMRMGLHHIKEKRQAINEVSRLLKIGGRFIIIDKYYLSRFELNLKGFIRLIAYANASVLGEYIVSKQEYEDLFSAKFTITKKEFIEPSFSHIGQAFMYVLEKKSD